MPEFWEEVGLLPIWPGKEWMTNFKRQCKSLLMFIYKHDSCLFFHTAPGGFHLGILPPAGLSGTAGLGVEPAEDKAGLLGAGLAAGGLLPGVEAAVKQSSHNINRSEWSINTIIAEFPFGESREHTCCHGFRL